MKSRSRIIMAFLLCACLIVGVGYATLVEQIIAEGTLQYNHVVPDSAKAIHFDGSSSITDADGNALAAAIATVDVTAGMDLAKITVLLDGDNSTSVLSNNQYVINITLGIELDNSEGEEALTVRLDNPTLSGNVNDGNAGGAGSTDNPFTVTAVMTGVTENKLTAAAAQKATATLKLTISMSATQSATVESTPFSVGIAVSEVTP